MGGDNLHSYASEDESSLEFGSDYPEYPAQMPPFYRDGLRMRDEDESVSGSSGFVCRGFDEVGQRISSNPVEFDGNLRRRKSAYNEIMKNYDQLWVRRESLYQAKSRILSYTPGSWISNAGGKKQSNYVVPKTTTLLLIGPKGSGKSSLVNRISRVFEDDKFASERAQVTYNSSSGEGTYFLQEYMIPRNATSFCLFDTRSLSDDFVDNDEMLQHWMTKGVRHGELVIRDSDNRSLKMALQCRARQSGSPSSEVRKVNFVIFVVDGFQVLKSMNSDKKEDRMYMEMVMKTFGYPYLSFKDDMPVIVVTHGDLLSLGDRARVRVYLGEKLGVPPAKQIFDIPDNSDLSTELTIVDMIRYCLEHADKNLPCRKSREWVERRNFSEDGIMYKVSTMPSILTLMFLAILLGISCVAFPLHRSHKNNEPPSASAINWHLKSNVNQHSYEPHEPLSKYAVNHSHKDQRHESRDPQTTPTPALPSKPVVDTSSSTPTLSSKPVEDTSSSTPTLPSRPVVDTSSPPPTPTLPSKPVVDRPYNRPESRSSSPENRHPKSAVKWHKIRHLWLDTD